MKTINFSTLGIGILIVLNIVLLSLFLFGRSPHRPMQACFPHHPAGDIHHPSMHTEDHRHAMHKNNKMHHDRQHRRQHHFDAKLDLSKEQQDQLDALNKADREKKENLHDKMEALHKKEHELLQNNALTAAQMNQLALEFAGYQKELHLMQLAHRSAFHQLLTPEQREEMKKRQKGSGI